MQLKKGWSFLLKPMKQLILFFLFSLSTFAQINYETRAVWIATNYGLDWPHSLDSTDQKKSLREIFDSIKAKNLNTVYFQVRGNGYVMYKSTMEEYSPYLTANPSKQTFDPLKYAIELAHRRNLEIHAWINVLKIYSTRFNKLPGTKKHLVNSHPGWIYEVNEAGAKSYWLNPALPEVANYLSKLTEELVRNYDIDGIHLDFLRYSYKYNENSGLTSETGAAEIRRNNITRLLEKIFYAVKRIKPYVEVGVTPIGINKNTGSIRGMEGYGEVYQDTEEWIKRGIVDYIVPQIYWNIEDRPKFEDVLDEWIQIAGGVNLVAGVAVYKNDVKNQLDKIVEIVRNKKNTGMAFFRYEHIKNLRIKGFNSIALPVKYIEAGKTPDIPVKLLYAGIKGNKLNISWSVPDSLKKYIRGILVWLQNGKIAERILVNGNSTTAGIRVNKLNQSAYFVKLQLFNRLWKPLKNEPLEVKVTNPDLDKFVVNTKKLRNPVLIKGKNSLRIILFSPAKSPVEVNIKTKGGFNFERKFVAYKGANVYRISLTENIREIIIHRGSNKFILKL